MHLRVETSSLASSSSLGSMSSSILTFMFVCQQSKPIAAFNT